MKDSYCIIINLLVFFTAGLCAQQQAEPLRLNDLGYYETNGLNILVFSNRYDGYFSDAKMSGIEIIQHGIRTVTNGDVRLTPTPEQWDSYPDFIDRRTDTSTNTIEVYLSYPQYNFDFRIKTEVSGDGLLISIILDTALPEELVGRAGFNLEFLPAAYFGRAYMMDDRSGIFPLYPGGQMTVNQAGETEPLPIASGRQLIAAPEDPLRKITVSARDTDMMLYDGRNKAQNGWFVLRSLLPAQKTGKVLEWRVEAHTVSGWIRQPVISYSQAGYHPEQKKIAVLELDRTDMDIEPVRLLKISQDSSITTVLEKDPEKWGFYLRFQYCTFDFSTLTDPGLYRLAYKNIISRPFRIAENVYEDAWHLTLDVFFPVQMDHMFVKEAYRVWHGAAHLDDALQAPVDHEHFDLYRQGARTDSPYQSGEHIPGLNVGGWFDAGDYDIRTQTHYFVIRHLVYVWEQFNIVRDETLIDQANRTVDIHHPDGKPDLLQQIEHGTLALVAQYRAVGHAISGIIVPSLDQYTHLGDGSTMTDNLVYDAALAPSETIDGRSGKFDDRWAFTSKSTALDYGAIAALAASSRALRGFNDRLAGECLEIAEKVWEEEQSQAPVIFKNGNTTGGPLETEELTAAVELLITTGKRKYAERILDRWPVIENKFARHAALAVRAIPYMGQSYSDNLKKLTVKYKAAVDSIKTRNPFGVPISEGGWAGNGRIVSFSITNYVLHQIFPEIIDKEDVLRGLNYILGCHPRSNISFVSGVGTESKKIAYGNNRADFSFIAGGVVPGILIVKPDYPENMEDWPYMWGENEYVISIASSYIYLVNAVNNLLNGEK